MEDNKDINLENGGVVDVQTNDAVGEFSSADVRTDFTSEHQKVDELTGVDAENGDSSNVVAQPEFASSNGVEQKDTNFNETHVKPKKKTNKTLIIVFIFCLIFGGVMLLMNMDDKNTTNKVIEKEQKEEKIEVNVGTEWGNKYLLYMLENKPELNSYEVSFIDVNYDGIPEMFLKYIDNSDKESLKILYIADDGYVYETKYYRNFRIRYIYSLKDKTTNWFLYLTTSKHYGSYTMISKIIDEMAFDADIKATNDSLLIEYGKKYYDTDYQPVFYNIKADSTENDFKNFVSKYDTYNEKVNKVKEEVEEKYKDYQLKEEEKESGDSISIAGKIYKFGTYFAYISANDELGVAEHTKVLVLYDDATISVDGILYSYKVNIEGGYLEIDGQKRIELLNNSFNYDGNVYKHSSET